MKNAAIIGILAAASLLTGCRSAIDKVRNGYLEYNKTTTVGQALEHTFSNGTWKTFSTDKGVTIVEFDGSEPFSKFRNTSTTNPPPDTAECTANLICAALDKKFNDYCNSAAGQGPYLKDYQDQRDNLKAKLTEVSRKADALYSQGVHDGEFNELTFEQGRLMTQIGGLQNPEQSCIDKEWGQNADDPIPVAIQFSINQDGTFQYEASDTFLNSDKLFWQMYN